MLARRAACLCLLPWLAGCGPTEHAPVTGVVRDGRTGVALAGASVRAEDGTSVTADDDGHFEVRAPVGDERVLRVLADGYCPVEHRVDVRKGGGAAATVHLFARLELTDELSQVGFGRDVELTARTRCDEDATVRWRRVAGPELAPDALRVEDGGRRVILHTPELEDVVTLDRRPGVVALSRVERGDYRFEVEAELGGRVERREVRVTAAAPTAGVYQVPTGADVYLNAGEGDEHTWELMSRPEGSETALEGADTRTPRLRPDRFGAYVLTHRQSGLVMQIMAGPYEDVPRDCGREGCHQAEDEGWTHTAHAASFRRGIEGELGHAFGVGCWSCHATGVDPGVTNGGLHNVAERIGFYPPAPTQGLWESLPRQIRRQGSVWCSACHGPGRILPPSFKWEYGAKYQVGVCAQCHDVTSDPDASHDSPQVREWRLAPMATFLRGLADDDPALREGCARCHSAQGFVEWRRRDEAIAPDARTVAPITCAACHDAHSGDAPRGLRAFDEIEVADAPATQLGGGAVCMACHRSGVARAGDDSMAPHAPQSEVLLGRGSRGIRRYDGPRGVHAALPNACVSCHMARPPEDDPLRGRAGGHTFSVRDLRAARGPRPLISRHSCNGCHGDGVPPNSIGGIVDRDGDGRADDVGEEYTRAMARARGLARGRISRAGVADNCAEEHTAADFVELDARLVLVDSHGRLLGDCDGDRRITGRERTVGIEQISRPIRYAIWDLAMLDKDGSRGVHNPRFSFDVIRAAIAELR